MNKRNNRFVKDSRVKIYILFSIILALLAFIPFLCNFIVDLLWYDSLGFLRVLLIQIKFRFILFGLTALVTGLFIYFVITNILLSYRKVAGVIKTNLSVYRTRELFLQNPKRFQLGIAIFLAVWFGFYVQSNWQIVQLFLHRKPFGYVDPQFHKNAAFYIFNLPFIQLGLSLGFALIIVSILLVILLQYLLGGIGLNNNRLEFNKFAKLQLAILLGILLFIKAAWYWFDRYGLLTRTSPFSAIAGASYTDINAVLPAKLILLTIAIIGALASFSVLFLRDIRIPAVSLVLMLLSMLLIGFFWPIAIQRFSVTPNAKEKERQYISHNIAATRYAFNLTKKSIDYQFITEASKSAKPLSNSSISLSASDKTTLQNLRLQDPNIVGRTFTQRQKLKNFYRFADHLYMDRYLIDGQLTDFVVGLRELDTFRLGDSQKNWVNLHTVYTHGNGFVAAPANQVDQEPGVDPLKIVGRGGFPVFNVSDTSNVYTDEYKKTAPIRVKQPRVYFGEILAQNKPDYAIVGGRGNSREYDSDTQYYTYAGKDGIAINNILHKALFTVKYGEINFFLSDQINKDSKILFERDPKKRVAKIAPWLKLDKKSYPAVMSDGSIKWIVDGYTTMNNFPYATKTNPDTDIEATKKIDLYQNRYRNNFSDDKKISYIRNSVKATVDAYDGTVALYQVDETDPVLSAWMDVFPGVVKPKDQIPKDLLSHFRYPEDIFKIQRNLLAQYHVNDPDKFFSGNDFWKVPIDQPALAAQQINAEQPPYYVIAADPKTGKPTFQLTSVYRVAGGNSENLTGYLSAKSDPEEYGKLTLKMMDTSVQTDGPKQVFDLMQTDTDVTRDRALLSAAAIVTYGNLLTLPLGPHEFIYLTPMYIESKNDKNSVPKIARILIYYNQQVGFGATLKQALAQVGINLHSSQSESNNQNLNSDSSSPGEKILPKNTLVQDKNLKNQNPKLYQAINELLIASTAVKIAKQSGNLADLETAISKLNQAEQKLSVIINN